MEEEITTKGIRINAPIYPGATVSVIPSEVINKIHKKQKLEFGSLKAHRQEDTYRLTTTQILIGVEVSKGRIIPVARKNLSKSKRIRLLNSNHAITAVAARPNKAPNRERTLPTPAAIERIHCDRLPGTRMRVLVCRGGNV